MTVSDCDDFSDEVPCEAGEAAPGMRGGWNAVAGDVLGTLWIGSLAVAAAFIGFAGRSRATAPDIVSAPSVRTVGAGR